MLFLGWVGDNPRSGGVDEVGWRGAGTGGLAEFGGHRAPRQGGLLCGVAFYWFGGGFLVFTQHT